MSFALSKSANPSKVFLTRKAEMTARWDPSYFRPELVAMEERVRKATPYRLRDFVQRMAGGATPSTKDADTHYTESADGVPFIRVQNLSTTGRLNLEDCKRITRSTHEGLLARSKLSGGELLVKITGVGRMAVASVVPDGFEANINQHIVAIRTKDRKTSETLAAWLNLDTAERLASRRSTGGTRPALDYPALLSIPIFFDERLPKLIGDAVSKYQAQLSKGSKLLASINDVLLADLGIRRKPEPPYTVENRVFRCSLSAISGERFDPSYYHAKYTVLQESIKEGHFDLVPLNSVCSLLSSGKTPSRDDYSDEVTEYPLIKVASYTDDEIDLAKVDYARVSQPYAIKQNDIFILSAAHQPEFVGRFVKRLTRAPEVRTSFVGELICARPDAKLVDPSYLFAVLSCSLFQDLLNREKRGQTSHIYSQDIGKIEIPLPSKTDQARIIEEIERIRAQAKSMLAEAAQNFEKAKSGIEALILDIKATK